MSLAAAAAALVAQVAAASAPPPAPAPAPAQVARPGEDAPAGQTERAEQTEPAEPAKQTERSEPAKQTERSEPAEQTERTERAKQTERAEEAASGSPPAASSDDALALAPPPGVRVARYAWDGAPPVPAPAHLVGSLVPGEAGVAPDVVAYLPLHVGEPPADRGPRALRVDAAGWEADPLGRFGGALAARGGAPPLRVEAAEGAPLLHGACTVALWLRLDAAPGARARLVEAPGLFALDRAPDGSLRLAVAGLERELSSAAPLAPGAWTHVGVALDPRLGGARLVVDGAAVGRRLPDGWAGGARALAVGGGLDLAVDELLLAARARSTDELAGLARPRAVVGERVLALALEEGGELVLRGWSGPSARGGAGAAELAGEALAAAAERDHLAPRGGALRWVEGQWRRDRPWTRPPARTTHPTVAVDGTRALVFGGETRDTHAPPFRNTADAWVYDARARAWTELAAGPAPSPRCHLAMAASPELGLALLAGGWRNDAEGGGLLHDDTWVLRLDPLGWERREPGGVALPPLANAPVVWAAEHERFLLLAGRHVLAYDPRADRWDRLPTPRVAFDGVAPFDYAVGGSAMAAWVPELGEAVLFGGERRGAFERWTAHYDPAAGTLAVLRPDPSPAPRVRSAFARDARRGRLVLFGGVLGQTSERFDDLWTYAPAERRWRRADAAGDPEPPSARGGYYGMAYLADLDRFLVLCGRHAKERFLDEAWRLALDPAATARARVLLDPAARPDADRVEADVRLPDGATAELVVAPWRDGPGAGPPLAAGASPPAGARLAVTVALTRGPAPDAAPPELLRLGLGPTAPPPPDTTRLTHPLPR